MSIFLECKKAKRTGLLPAFLGGGTLAAAVPVVNMAVRSKMYLAQPGSPIQILLDANWQVMAMLNVLLITAGTCLLYHTEYAENAMQKMQSLPIRESAVFFSKAVLTMLMSGFMLLIELAAAAFCSYYWFQTKNVYWSGLCRSFGYAFLRMLPCIILSLLISQICKNMWVSLGIGVVCVFTASMLPTDSFLLSLFPYAAPFQTFTGTDTAAASRDICATAAELAVLGLSELLFIKIRRAFE